MFGIDSSEFLLIAVVALVVIGPKDLPRVMRLVGGWVGRGRAMTRHLRSGFDTMMREAEMEEMQKQWAKQNAEIMAATAAAAVAPHAYDPAVAPHAYDPAAAPHAYDPAAAPHVEDAVVGEHVYDHPGALVADDASFSTCHPRAGGDPRTQTVEVMGPRLRGDDKQVEGAVATPMTGPRPTPYALTEPALAEPAIPLEPAPTAQP